MNKKKGGISSLVALLLVAGGLAISNLNNNNQQAAPQGNNQPKTEQISKVPEKELQQEAVQYSIEDVDLADPPRFEKIKVENLRSVDGDTFAFRSRGRNFKLRLLMVDTPESVKEGMAVQPFGKEASDFTKKQLQKGTVSIAFDKGAVKDKYDRYLAYVYVDDQLLQGALLANGLGIVRYVDSGGDSYLNDLLAYQKKAEEQKIGVWSIKDYVFKTKTAYYRYNEK